jgi:hypothetical protein
MALSNDCKMSSERIMLKTDEFLKTVFPKTHMTLKDFRLSIEKKNSDLFFIVIFYLMLRNPFNDEILGYYKNDRRTEKLKKKVKWTEKKKERKETATIKLFIGLNSYNRLTNTLEDSVKEGSGNDEDELLCLDEEFAISELYEIVIISPFKNPHISKSNMSAVKQSPRIIPNKDQSTEAQSMFDVKVGSKLLDMVFSF